MAEKNLTGAAAPSWQGGGRLGETNEPRAGGAREHGATAARKRAGEAAGADLSSQEEAQAMPRHCREVMSENPVCCLPTDTIDVAARLMVTEDIGALPVVVDLATLKLLGIVTDRDLAVKAVAEGCDPKSTMVEEVMTYEPVTCQAHDELEHVLELMAEHQVRRVPVVDAEGCLVGIIAQADIATRVPSPEKTARVVEEISKSIPEEEESSEVRH